LGGVVETGDGRLRIGWGGSWVLDLECGEAGAIYIYDYADGRKEENKCESMSRGMGGKKKEKSKCRVLTRYPKRM
jgi:hypothetical protein